VEDPVRLAPSNFLLTLRNPGTPDPQIHASTQARRQDFQRLILRPTETSRILVVSPSHALTEASEVSGPIHPRPARHRRSDLQYR
jgi:hypothetical protein